MTKQTKIMIGTGIGVLALVVFLSIKANAKANNTNINTIDNSGGATPPKSCQEGEITCPNNPNKCYNPLLTYLVNPCN